MNSKLNIIPQGDIPNDEYRLYLSFINLNIYGVTFLPGDFTKSKPSIFHLEVEEELMSDSTKPFFIIVPRQHAKCLHPDSEILMYNGSYKKVSSIDVNDEIVSLNEETLKVEKDLVIMSTKTEIQPVYTIKTLTGRIIKASYNHRVFTWNGWKNVGKSLSTNDRIAALRKVEKLGHDKGRLYEAKLIAHLITEGSLSGIDVRYTNTDKEVINDFIECSEKCGMSVKRVSNTITFRLSGTTDGSFISWKNGKAYNVNRQVSKAMKFCSDNNIHGTSKTKRIPKWIFKQPDDVLWEFINVFMVTDGWFASEARQGGITLTNEKLIDDLNKIFIRLGIIATKLRRLIKDYDDAYSLIFGATEVFKMLENCSLLHKREKALKIIEGDYFSLKDAYPPSVLKFKKHTGQWFRENGCRVDSKYDVSRSRLQRLIKLEYNKDWRKLENADVFWDKIVSIELDETPVQTYDIETENNHNFFVDGLCTHNTTITKCSIMHDLSFSKQNLGRFGDISTSRLKDFWYQAAAEREKAGPRYFVWIAKSQDDSKRNAKYMRKHFDESQVINSYFGNMRGETWNKESIITRDGDFLVCGSNMKSVRGTTEATVSHGALRIYRAFMDDCENEQNTKTFASREEIKKTFLAAILPAIETTQPKCRAIWTGTPVHFDSMVQNVLDEYSLYKKEGREAEYPYKVITYPATQPTMPGGVLWNDYMSREVLDNIKKRYQTSNPPKLHLYYQEYELQVSSPSTANWTKDHIKYHDYSLSYGDELVYLMINNEPTIVKTFLGCDPATDIETKSSDYSVIMVIAVDQHNRRYVLDYVRKLSIPTIGQRDPSTDILIGKKGVVDYIIELYDKYHCTLGTVEDVAMTRSVFQALNSRKRLLNRHDISIVGAKPSGREKHNKIYTYLDGLFANGQVYCRESHYDLINEIVTFGPLMAHDDTIETFYFANRNAFPPKGAFKRLSVEESMNKVKEGIDLTLGRYLKEPRRRGISWKTR